jgi:nitroimidazol reductase NimA-like FMN-containing flavoprotein (pyridoxamine 5'-phosphate oxidase superfamily)
MTVDELEKYGMRQMDDDEIRQILSTQDVGILGLPTGGAPSMRPLSFWFDGAETIYFTYVVGSQSGKVELSNRADFARFLVYRIETTFNWRSALFTGRIEPVPAGERDAIEAEMENQWRPEVFERASESEDTSLYRFEIEDRAGVLQTDLPPELRTESSRK